MFDMTTESQTSCERQRTQQCCEISLFVDYTHTPPVRRPQPRRQLHAASGLAHYQERWWCCFAPAPSRVLSAAFFSEVQQSFFGCHAATVSIFSLLDKSCRTPP